MRRRDNIPISACGGALTLAWSLSFPPLLRCICHLPIDQIEEVVADGDYLGFTEAKLRIRPVSSVDLFFKDTAAASAWDPANRRKTSGRKDSAAVAATKGRPMIVDKQKMRQTGNATDKDTRLRADQHGNEKGKGLPRGNIAPLGCEPATQQEQRRQLEQPVAAIRGCCATVMQELRWMCTLSMHQPAPPPVWELPPLTVQRSRPVGGR